MNIIVLGGGCFWCIEAVYQRVKGVEKVESGYAGGTKENPTYNDHGDHAEVIQVSYDAKVISLEKLLEIFFYIHDPTTLNFQGNDFGTQYRSIILCAKKELDLAEKAKTNAQEMWAEPVVTEVEVLDKFYLAEDHHQDFFNKNQGNPYCQVIINPKIAKFEIKFKELLKK